MDKVYLSADDYLRDIWRLAKLIRASDWKVEGLVALWRGGAPVGVAVHEFLKVSGWDIRHLPMVCSSYTAIGENEGSVKFEGADFVLSAFPAGAKVLVVDDVFDTGKTAEAVMAAFAERGVEARFACVYFKPGKNKTNLTPDYFVRALDDRWLVFPHEIEGLTEEERRKKDPVLGEIFCEK